MKEVKEPAPPQAIPLCIHCGAEIGTSITRCPQCGQPPLASDVLRAQDRQLRANLARASAPVATLVSSAPSSAVDSSHLPPVLAPDVTQFYLPPARPATGPLRYQPRLLGFAEVVFIIDRQLGKEHKLQVRLVAPPPDPGHPVRWEQAQSAGERLEDGPRPGSSWEKVPTSADTGRKLKALQKAFADWLYSTCKLTLWQNRKLKLVSEPGEARDAFQERCRKAAQAEAQRATDLERARFGPKFEALGMKLPQTPTASGSIFSLGWLQSLLPSTSAASPREEEKQRKLKGDFEGKLAEIREKWKRIGEEAMPLEVKLRKVDILVTHFGLAWVPA
jgi:hypothetical protein